MVCTFRFKKYQDTFPPCADVVAGTTVRTAIITDKMKNMVGIFCRFIKSICKFQTAMKDILIRSNFEAYLRLNWHDFSCRYISSMGKIESVGLSVEDGDLSYLKRRVINNKLLIVDFLVNDLSFYQETESFRNMADSGTMMASAWMYGENDHTALNQKADMIMKLLLKSEISPKLGGFGRDLRRVMSSKSTSMK
ncbi:regulator of G-protein signaling protein-like [Osmerus eperlanus]|uniref:regulator of G-protein signaling protein-like n=1 Tax=Osmerus eperlanus TaxID=29151 RepID=UPI002E1408DA